MDYKGIKISSKVIIVEKPLGGYSKSKEEVIHQGYVVDVGNDKMLETAKSWADCGYFTGEYKWNPTPEEAKAYKDSYIPKPGIIHEYDNGQFELTLDEAAGYSSQGGKLSFWNCLIKCPDGNTFLIGINSELLLHLMMKNTLVNGVCQSKVWLGRIKGSQVGAFTENMEEFDQAKEDEKTRNLKKTNKYVAGDIVETLREKYLYLGELYKWGDKFFPKSDRGWHSSMDEVIGIYDKPKKVHGFVRIYGDELTADTSGIHIEANKNPRLVTGHNDKYLKKYLKVIADYMNEYNKLETKTAGWFRGFTNNTLIRINDIDSPERIRQDVLDVLAYSGYSLKPKVELVRDIVDTHYEDSDYYDNVSYFSNYKGYYKKNDK